MLWQFVIARRKESVYQAKECGLPDAVGPGNERYGGFRTERDLVVIEVEQALDADLAEECHGRRRSYAVTTVTSVPTLADGLPAMARASTLGVVRIKLIRFEGPGLLVKSRWSRPFTIAYGEILTAERSRSRRSLRLHNRAADELRLFCGADLEPIEAELRRRGVRIVDCWGAILAPTLDDFNKELVTGPARLRQSSDDA
jgi:hypothetical protein